MEDKLRDILTNFYDRNLLYKDEHREEMKKVEIEDCIYQIMEVLCQPVKK